MRVTDHADEEIAADRLTLQEVFDALFSGEIIEEYPTDRPYPSCLVYGQTAGGKPVHTVYRPDPNRWINWRERRKPP